MKDNGPVPLASRGCGVSGNLSVYKLPPLTLLAFFPYP